LNLYTTFENLYRVINNKSPDSVFYDAVDSVVQLSGRAPEQFPKYIATIVSAMANKITLKPEAVPVTDRSYSWLLRELIPIYPECEFVDEVERELFVCRSLGLAAVITRGDENYSVVSWPEHSPLTSETRVIGTFDPSEEQIREWAYKPELRLTAQDEGEALSHQDDMPLLIELACDPECPKRDYLISLADGYIANAQRGTYDRELLEKSSRLAAACEQPDLQAWSRELYYILEYLEDTGPVTVGVADNLSRLIMSGRYRPGVHMERTDTGPWWQFAAYHPISKQVVDYLYICRKSGSLLWSNDPLSQETLAPFIEPERRDQYLSVRGL
jgi:hypothetical protein